MSQTRQQIPSVSIIIPTFQESDNLNPLINSINSTLLEKKINFEIIIVDDDSRDGSIEIINKLSKNNIPVSIYVREKVRGLSSAVLYGFRKASFPVLAVMDADLSHSPKDVPKLLKPIFEDKADFVLGSRNVEGSKINKHWGFLRHLNTQIATFLTRPLSRIKDPMSGFFALKRTLLAKASFLNPVGYKIGLELIVKTKPSRIVEIPIEFGLRAAGQSKLTLKQQLLFLTHLKRLYEFRWYIQTQFLLFAIVGFLGVFVDIFAMMLLYGAAGIPFQFARIPSFLVAATFNFQLNRMITFSDSTRSSWIRQWIGFLSVSALGFIGNWFVSVNMFHYHPLFMKFYFIPVIVGSIAGAFVNFTLSKIAVFDSSAISGLTPGVKPVVFEDDENEGRGGLPEK